MIQKYIEAISDPQVLNEPFNNPAKLAKSLSKLLKELTKAERFPEAKIKFLQEKKLRNILKFAAENCPYYTNLIKPLNIDLDSENLLVEFKKLPLLERQDIQKNQQNIEANFVYQTHLPTSHLKTSGSSGEPVRIKKTGLTDRFWQANTMRQHNWSNSDFSQNIAVIRADLFSPQPISMPDWGMPANLLHKNTGRGYALQINRPINEQIEWLKKTNAGYLTTYPSNLNALLDIIEDKKINFPYLKLVKTTGETVSDDLRVRTKEVLGVEVIDVYSSQETGPIAMECCDNKDNLYHIISENIIVEILDDKGEEVQEGETGKVVITDLVNYAMPLIRYNIKDYATKGNKCSCGRTLPTLKKILGRERNMAVHNEQKFWPIFGSTKLRDISSIQRYQLVQTAENKITFKYVAQNEIDEEQRKNLTRVISEDLGFVPEIYFEYFSEDFPMQTSGKFEEFICKI